MSLIDSIDALNEVAAKSKALVDSLSTLAANGEPATEAQHQALRRLTAQLETCSKQAARDRRTAEIEQLTIVIDAHEATLAVPGLSREARDAVKADLTRKRARRTRLRNLAATDFGGVLSADEVRDIVELVDASREETDDKRFASALLDVAMKTADLALSIAGKVAL